jgi:release factor H-coupled RctB family protein
LKDTDLSKVRLIASSNNWIEGAAVQQLEKTASLPGMRLAVGLPDLHPGKGSPIGAAFAVEGYLYPALVGSDIGCGIGLWKTGLGAGKLKRDAWADRLRNLESPWAGDIRQFLRDRGMEPCGFEHSLGTIGGGNHFAELQAVESVESPEICERLGITRDAVYLCVHSGSRGFGESVLREHMAQFGFGSLELGTGHAARYLGRHDHARLWASANRELIACRVFDCLKTEGARLIDICHNSVEERVVGGISCWIHRKGAAPSTEGAVLIPGSRGAFTYVVAPLDPHDYSAFSLAHGAGRKWSRSDCRARIEKRFSARDLARTDLDSRVICEDKELLFEEAPQAYKNISIVIDDLVKTGLAAIVAVLRPLVTYKVRR